MSSVLETINRIMAWKGYRPELTPHIEELKRISDKAGRRERVTDKEVAFINELEAIITGA